MGCRVIFSCLKELTKHLAALEEGEGTSAGDKVCEDVSGGGGVSECGVEDHPTTEPSPPPQAPQQEKTPATSSSMFSFCSRAEPAADQNAPSPSSPEEKVDANTTSVKTARELKGLIKDVVLLGAPLNLKVSTTS